MGGERLNDKVDRDRRRTLSGLASQVDGISLLRQSIYYPYAWALRHARGQVLDVRVDSETGSDLKAFNTFEQPRRVAPQRLDAPAVSERMVFKLAARSYTVAQLATS